MELLRRDWWASARGGASVALFCALALWATGCRTDEGSVPSRLADGTQARTSTIAFEGVDAEVVMTTSRSVDASENACRPRETGSRRIERVDARGTSVTVVSRDRRWIWACDATGLRRACGHAFGRLEPRRTLDPRLSLTCRDADGAPLGFAWVQPSPTTRYVVVERDGYAEAYRVRGGTPVRVTADDVDGAESSARVRYSEHARDGSLLRTAMLDAHVSD